MVDKGLVNMGLSVLDPEVEKFTQRIAEAIPADSPLRSTILSRIFAVAKAWIESRDMPGLTGALVEKLTDYGDFLVANLTGSATTSNKKVVDGGRDWMDKFFAEAGERLKKAPTPEAARAEVEKIKVEFALRRELLQVIEDARREATPAATTAEATPSIDWAELRAKLIVVKVAVPVNKFADKLEKMKGGKR